MTYVKTGTSPARHDKVAHGLRLRQHILYTIAACFLQCVLKSSLENDTCRMSAAHRDKSPNGLRPQQHVLDQLLRRHAP
jgi:hypothetical protein